MKILIESYFYPKHILDSLLNIQELGVEEKNDKIAFHCVGYYYAAFSRETFIILPKIFLNAENNMLLECISPEIAATTSIFFIPNFEKVTLLHQISWLFYLSLKEFRKRKNSTIITQTSVVPNIISNQKEHTITELELIFSLLKFYQHNKNLLLFKQKEVEKSHINHVNWNKTIQKQQPLIDNPQTPIYIQVNQYKKTNNNEDDLLKIYYTVLASLKEQYMFDIIVPSTIVLQKVTASFVQKSLRTLKLIKGQYFQDKFKKLLFLLIAYFEKIDLATIQRGHTEFLLCRDYHIVFEDMTDKILVAPTEAAGSLKNQKDGKILDHIFKYKSLLDNSEIYYIGDSKYYKDTTSYSLNSIYKQFTYSKNVIQDNIDFLNKGRLDAHIRYRDELTEGYNITPNFFVQGYINYLNWNDVEPIFEFDNNQQTQTSFHFFNRIFDRDTLFIYSFKINFISLLMYYVGYNSNSAEKFVLNIKNKIRTQIQQKLQEQYYFFRICIPIEEHSSFIERNFFQLHGKIYKTDSNILMLGLLRDNLESHQIQERLKPYLQILELN